MNTPSSKYVPSGPVMAASHSKKLSSVMGPAAIPAIIRVGSAMHVQYCAIVIRICYDLSVK